MWCDYEASYSATLNDQGFLLWRELGAHNKALNIVRVCHGIHVGSVVEIGCGTGDVLRFLNKMNLAREYSCVDVSVSTVQFARKACAHFLKNAYISSANALPFQEGTFDVAILTHVLEHLVDPVCALREASRVARFVVIEVPIEKVLSNAIRRKVLKRPYPSMLGSGHVQFWSQKSIVDFLERDCGLTILERHRDLISRDVEFHDKLGLSRVKPALKETLKTVLPQGIYCRLLTTHATFLCRSPASPGLNRDVSSVCRKEAV